MRGTDRVYLAVGLGAAVAVIHGGGCGGGGQATGTGGAGGHGGSTSSSSTASSSSSSSSTTTSSSGVPCPPSTVLAVSQLYFGEGNNGEWKAFGFDLDGKTSTASSTDLCQLNSGATPDTAYPDGNSGIDNSFGKNLLPLIIGVDSTWPTDVNTGIQQGQFTALLEIACLYPTGDIPTTSTKIFAGTPLGMMPKWDGTDKWPVEPDLLDDPKNPESSSIVFTACSVMGTTFDAGKDGMIVLTIPVNLQGKMTSIKLTLYAARLTMTLSADRKSATGGKIGGVLNTEEFVTEVKKLGFLLGLCSDPTLVTLETLARQASDIMSDGTQDPTKTCDGISVGFGFDMKEAQIGVVGPAAPNPVTCP